MSLLTCDPERVQNSRYDLLIIGAGVQGAAICYKAAQQGLKVLLVDKGDFCGASSSNSLKILHGGLRYLQTLDFKRMRQSIRARRELMQLAPHLVEPLACAMPAYGHGLKGKEVMRAAMLLNDMISSDRNRGLPSDKRLPAGHTLSQSQCLEMIPGLATQGLHGASVWYDALALNTERLVMEYILQAAEMSADAINYTPVLSVQQQAGGLSVQLKDLRSGRIYTARARRVINCAGVCYENLNPDAADSTMPVRWARGLNIIVKKKLFEQGAVALEKTMDAQKRMLFMVPWREQYTMIGTHYKQVSKDDALLPVEAEDIQMMLEEMNVIYPPANLHYDDVSYYHAGYLPVDERSPLASDSPLRLSKESIIIDHGKQGGMQNFYSIQGIKYTTAPQVADRILKLMGLSTEKVKRADDFISSENIATDGDEIKAYLQKKYGARAINLMSYLQDDQRWLDTGHRLLHAELQYFMHEELACHLSDVVFRRSELGTAECPPVALLKRIADIMSQHFCWSEQQRASELEQVLQRYTPLTAPH